MPQISLPTVLQELFLSDNQFIQPVPQEPLQLPDSPPIQFGIFKGELITAAVQGNIEKIIENSLNLLNKISSTEASQWQATAQTLENSPEDLSKRAVDILNLLKERIPSWLHPQNTANSPGQNEFSTALGKALVDAAEERCFNSILVFSKMEIPLKYRLTAINELLSLANIPQYESTKAACIQAAENLIQEIPSPLSQENPEKALSSSIEKKVRNLDLLDTPPFTVFNVKN